MEFAIRIQNGNVARRSTFCRSSSSKIRPSAQRTRIWPPIVYSTEPYAKRLLEFQKALSLDPTDELPSFPMGELWSVLWFRSLRRE